MKKIKRVIEDVSQSQLFDVDAFADKLWQNYDIDVEFTRHFVDRVNDPRNGIPGINSAQLIRLLRKEYEKYGNDIANMDNGEEAVMKDTKTSVNMPFVMNTGRDGKKLIAKTIMKKKDFKTPDQEFVVNEMILDEILQKPVEHTSSKEAIEYFNNLYGDKIFKGHTNVMGTPKMFENQTIVVRIMESKGNVQYHIHTNGKTSGKRNIDEDVHNRVDHEIMNIIYHDAKPYLHKGRPVKILVANESMYNQYKSMANKMLNDIPNKNLVIVDDGFELDADDVPQSAFKIYEPSKKKLPEMWVPLGEGSEFVVNEVLDKPLPFTLVGNDYDRVLYAFETKDGVEASVSFELLEGMTEEEDVWEMSFTVDGKAAIPLDRSPNAYAVFATVASILSDFLRTHPEANNIAFNASIKEPSRIKLYDRLSKMMPKLGLKLDFVEQGSETKYYQFSRVGTNLNEVLDKPMPYELIKKGHSYIYQFESQEGKMSEVTFKKMYDDDDDDDDGSSSSSGGTRWDMDFSVDGSWTIPTTKGSLGNALSVFATVTQILRDFIRTRRDAEIISFNASLDEPSRVRLYDRLASKMPQLGFKLDYSGDVHGNKYYKFRRVGTNLNEVLDKPVPYELIDDSYGNAIYEFRTENGKKCLVTFEMTEDEDNPSGANWEMNFTVDGKLTIPTTKGSLSNALSVFATVTQIMADFIRTHSEARTILFSAKLAEPSRVKLYDRLATKMPQLGFKLDRSGDAHGYKIYLFRKIGTKLNEVLDKPLPYELIEKGYGYAMYEFESQEGKRSSVTFDMIEDEDNPSESSWEMAFEVGGSRSIPTTKGSLSNALAVFATVTQILTDFIKTHPKVKIISFSASMAEPSRVKLYDRLAMKMPQLGFKLDYSGDVSGYKYYAFRKVGTKLKENSSAGATCSGAIATASQPMGMLSRNGGGLLSGKPTNEPFPNTPDWIKKSVKQWKRQNKQLR